MSRRGWYRAPVVHFVLLGGLLFGAERAWHAARRDSSSPAADPTPAAEPRQVREDLERWGYPAARAEREAEARRERRPVVISAQRLAQIQERSEEHTSELQSQ